MSIEINTSTQEEPLRTITQGVALVIFRNKGELLLQLRDSNTKIFPNFWSLPTGALDHPQELILDAAKRELIEETGLEIELRFILAEVYNHPTLGTAIRYLFMGKCQLDSNILCNEGHDMQFVNIKRLPGNFVPHHLSIIRSLLKS